MTRVTGVTLDDAMPMNYSDAMQINKDKEWTTAVTSKKKNHSNSKKTPSIMYGRATNSIIKLHLDVNLTFTLVILIRMSQ